MKKLVTLLTLIAGPAISSFATDKVSRPNIIFILAHDLGLAM